MRNGLPRDCARFSSMLDDRLDGVLSEENKAFMDGHAGKCGACAERMRLSLGILSVMKGLDDSISVPPKAQAAWRRAVRAEKARNNRRWVTRISGIAAAIAVLIGSTAWMRSTGALDIAANTAIDYSAALHSKRRIAVTDAYSPLPAVSTRMIAPMLVESDGGMAGAYAETREKPETENSSAGLPDEALIVADEAPTLGVEAAKTSAESAVTSDEARILAETEESVEADAMLVRSAYRTARTECFDKDRENLRSLVDEYGGYMALDEARVSENGIDREAVSEIRVPAALLDEFLTALENVGTTLSVQLKNEDVSAYYFDAESRLFTQQAVVSRLNELILTAAPDEIQSLNQQLKDAYDEIDDLKSVMLAYKGEMTYANVRMELFEGRTIAAARIERPTPTREPTLSERSASGFRQSLNKVRTFFEDMIVSMAIIAPVALTVLFAAAIVGGAVYLVKRGKRNGSKDKTNNA